MSDTFVGLVSDFEITVEGGEVRLINVVGNLADIMPPAAAEALADKLRDAAAIARAQGGRP
jgi:hypothetical protein